MNDDSSTCGSVSFRELFRQSNGHSSPPASKNWCAGDIGAAPRRVRDIRVRKYVVIYGTKGFFGLIQLHIESYVPK